MLKGLAIIGVCLICAGMMAGQADNNSRPNPQPTKHEQPTLRAVNGEQRQADAGNDKGKPDGISRGWYASLKWPQWMRDSNWWLLIVAALTGGIICWQSIETRKAGQSVERQIALQASAMRQWINIVPLGIGIPRTLENPCEITLQFGVLNKTDYLVTIKGVEFELVPNIHSIGKFKVDCDFPLVPRKSEDDSAFPFTGKCVIDIGELDGGGKIFIVAGTVTFLDCMNNKQVQSFQDLYRGFMDGRLERMNPVSITATEDESESHDPN